QQPNIEESPAWELINQIPSQKPMPTLYHSRLQKRLLAVIDSASGAYEALPELRCILSANSIVPDIAIVRAARLPLSNQALAGPLIGSLKSSPQTKEPQK
ncbi:MAG: Uma2 family endonuclease, partial [Cyanobacteriota bacterium]|nr:Uma2 family endonuclease [Cyanobacteriota bacterium]